MDGIRFVAEPSASQFLEGLVVDVVNTWGRDALVATHPELRGC
ncbi:MAG TPA: hypothetical protein VGK67_23285 [Myxococcales bacterium]